MGVKHYAYYIKGNKFALVEKDTSFDNDVTSKEYGPGTDRAQWKSPKSAIENGIEIQYTHAPNYRLNISGDLQVNATSQTSAAFGIFGWTVIGGYLAFVHGSGQQNGAYKNFAGASYDDELGTAGTDSILIQNSNRWNGVHKIKARGDGYIQVDKKVSLLSEFEGATFDLHDENFTVDDDNVGNGIQNLFQLDTNNTVYFFLRDGDTAGDGSQTLANNNEQIYKATFDGNYTLTASQAMFIDTLSGATATVGDGLTWSGINMTGDYMDDVTNGNYYINKIYKDNCTLYGKGAFDIMEDETFELDLPDYLSRALIHYVKAQFLEDLGQIELSEYFMTKFRKKVEEYMSTRHAGPKQASGFWHMR
tara:strand:+ start:768 stop:1856 length:1089 start_codon:yes stop_codon:yes gene_type:complete